MRTWVDTHPGIMLKDEAFAHNDRFSIDPEGLFLFSSSQSTMMPGRIAIRTVRVELCFADDKYVNICRARDKLSNVFMEERIREAEQQREGLSLASLFAKPRPMWTAQAFYGYYGDAFIENTALENADMLAWAYTVLNYAMQGMIKQSILTDPKSGFDRQLRGLVSDVIHSMQQSVPIFKQMMKLTMKNNPSMLMNFLKKIKGFLSDLKQGHSLLLPCVVENIELLMLVERTNDRVFRFVIIQTDPHTGLRHHAVSPHISVPSLTYR